MGKAKEGNITRFSLVVYSDIFTVFPGIRVCCDLCGIEFFLDSTAAHEIEMLIKHHQVCSRLIENTKEKGEDDERQET